jgi:SAM-dependent methyltransferase
VVARVTAPETRFDSAQYFARDLEAMAGAGRYHQWIADLLSPYLGRRVAEVGAGCGNFTPFLAKAGAREIVSYEPSDNMFPLLQASAARLPGASAVHAFFGEESSPPAPFDAAVYINVMEHVEHDGREVARVFQALKPGGHLGIFVPALPFLYSKFDRQVGHYRRYTKPGLVALLRQAGFEVPFARYLDLPGVFIWWVAFTLGGCTLTPGIVSPYDRFVIPVIRAFESIFPAPLGKNLIAVGRKPGP